VKLVTPFTPLAGSRAGPTATGPLPDCSRATTDMPQRNDRHLHSGHNLLNRLCGGQLPRLMSGDCWECSYSAQGRPCPAGRPFYNRLPSEVQRPSPFVIHLYENALCIYGNRYIVTQQVGRRPSRPPCPSSVHPSVAKGARCGTIPLPRPRTQR
jgi:hypothetical protein